MDATVEAVPVKRAGRFFVGLVRVVSVLTPLAILFQATTAGLFVTGRVSFLSMHDIGAGLVAVFVLLSIVAAVLLRWPGGGSPALIPFAAFMLVLVVVQMAVGFTRSLAVHLPLGVLLFGMSAGFAARAFSQRVTRRDES